jgi:hemerythrin-like metal-binding protein
MKRKWDEIHSVNIKILDDQHRQLVSITNELSESKDQKDLKKILKKLNKYALKHFFTEKKLFDKFNYPGAEEHAKHHKYFLDKLKNFEDKFKSGKLFSKELMDFLSDWWIWHVNNEDIKYSDFLNQHGIF